MRAVGMTRRQVRSLVRWEAVIIALLGAFLGIVIGVVFGWVMVSALSSEGISTFRAAPVQLRRHLPRRRRLRRARGDLAGPQGVEARRAAGHLDRVAQPRRSVVAGPRRWRRRSAPGSLAPRNCSGRDRAAPRRVRRRSGAATGRSRRRRRRSSAASPGSSSLRLAASGVRSIRPGGGVTRTAPRSRSGTGPRSGGRARRAPGSGRSRCSPRSGARACATGQGEPVHRSRRPVLGNGDDREVERLAISSMVTSPDAIAASLPCEVLVLVGPVLHESLGMVEQLGDPVEQRRRTDRRRRRSPSPSAAIVHAIRTLSRSR